ncbi:MAG: ATP-dependent DNA ligase [Candidatus Bathyarchaeia archaeon]
MAGLRYSQIADTYERIESTSKRLEMTDLLVDLIRATPKELLGKVAYLTQGKLYPDFVGIETGIAEKTAISAISKATGFTKEDVTKEWKRLGDLGLTAEELLSKAATGRAKLVTPQPLTVERVYDTFDKIAKISGEGAVENKLKLLSEILTQASPKEARYIIRTVTGKLRLGIGDMTFLDALAIAYGGGKEARDLVERAYNMSSDLGMVAQTLADRGLEGIKGFGITIGRPVRPMLCERLTSAQEVLAKLGGKGASEFKYDGLRIQAHISRQGISLFSRRLENLTEQFPDVVNGLLESVNVEEAVVEGECVAVDPNTGEMRPFQVVTHRRGRKYDVKETAEEIPVVLFLFDILYLNGKTLVDAPYEERRKALESVVRETDSVKITHPEIVSDPERLNKLMEEAVEAGCEGLVVKSLSRDSVYQAGARGFLWVKYKREYRSELADTLDLVVVGAFAGRGRRAGTYGALLMAAYDEEMDTFKTVCKLGTGFSDEELASLPEVLKEYSTDHPHPRLDSTIKADFWFVPMKVLEVRGAELTLSPSHTCGFGVIRKDSGLAVRFPRFTGKWRDDKGPEDATTVKEIIEMYKSQLKRVKD